MRKSRMVTSGVPIGRRCEVLTTTARTQEASRRDDDEQPNRALNRPRVAVRPPISVSALSHLLPRASCIVASSVHRLDDDDKTTAQTLKQVSTSPIIGSLSTAIVSVCRGHNDPGCISFSFWNFLRYILFSSNLKKYL